MVTYDIYMMTTFKNRRRANVALALWPSFDSIPTREGERAKFALTELLSLQLF